jgi:hypothetical protein
MSEPDDVTRPDDDVDPTGGLPSSGAERNDDLGGGDEEILAPR